MDYTNVRHFARLPDKVNLILSGFEVGFLILDNEGVEHVAPEKCIGFPLQGCGRHCQTNLSRPAKGAGPRRSGRQLPPLGQGGGTVLSDSALLRISPECLGAGFLRRLRRLQYF